MPVEPEKDDYGNGTETTAGLTEESEGSTGAERLAKRDLLSLISSLAHASRAIKPGRSYLRRLINLSTTTRQLDQFVRLN